MPGGWTMSMAWMRMPGQTWPGAAASFLGMWVVMMVAMMLPSLVPMLWRYRQAVGETGETRLGRLTALVGVGYFFVWTVFGMAAFPLGVALAAIEMQQPALARAVPIAVGVVVLIAGVLQLSRVEGASPRLLPGGARARPYAAGRRRHGLATRPAPRPPLHLLLCRSDGDPPGRRGHGPCARWPSWRQPSPSNVSHPAGERVARAIGAVVVGAGLVLIARAAGLG